MHSQGTGQDKSSRGEAVLLTAASSSKGGANDIVVLSPELQRPTEASTKLTPRAKELEDDKGEDNVPLA